jgi:hypothetical protein
VKRHFQATVFALGRLGLLGWVGVMLAVATVAYAAIVVPKQNAELSGASAEIARLQQLRMAMESTLKTSAVGNLQAEFAAELPTLKSTPEALLTLEDIAREDNLQIKRNDYRYVEPVPPSAGKNGTAGAEHNPVVEVRIAIPASGKYSNIRAFIAHALENLPTLALDEMSLKRDSIGQGDIQAQLRFALFVRGGS